MSESESDPKPSGKNGGILKYTGMAFQLAFYLGIGLLLGSYLDRKLQNSTPYCTAFFPLVFLIGYLFKLIREFTK